MSDEQMPQICTGCDKPTTEGRKFLLGVMCPPCDRKWDVLCEALESIGGLQVQEKS